MTHYAHCRLLPGGAAQTLTHFITQHGHDSQTKIFTLFSDIDTRTVDGQDIPVICALPRGIQSVFFFFQKHRTPLLSRLFDYRNLMFFYPQLIALLRRKINRHQTDHLIISSFAVTKNIVTPSSKPTYRTTLYLHSPMQYIHTHSDEYRTKLTGIKGRIFRSITQKLTKRDTLPRHYDTIIANSHYTANCAEKIYNLTTDHVQYPPIDEQLGHQAPILSPDNYFVYVGRLVAFVKEVEKLINLANQTGENLVLIGSGPDEAYLKSIAGPTCLFVGQIDDIHEKIDIIRKSRGLRNITKESFGIATAEALLCGVPVLGYADGASPELVDEHSGTLISLKDKKSLSDGLRVFASTSRDRPTIQNRAKKTFGQGDKE